MAACVRVARGEPPPAARRAQPPIPAALETIGEERCLSFTFRGHSATDWCLSLTFRGHSVKG